MEGARTPLLSAQEQYDQQQVLPTSTIGTPRSPRLGASAPNSNTGAANRLANLVRRPSPAAAGGAAGHPDAKYPRSRSTGKAGTARPLADGRMAPRNNFRLPSQMPVQLRQKDKLVLLPRSASEQHEADAAAAVGWVDRQRQLSEGDADLSEQQQQQPQQQQPASSLFVDLTEVLPDSRGRVTVYCISESLDRSILESLAAAQTPDAVLTSYSEVLHLSLPVPQGSEPADCFFFGKSATGTDLPNG